MGLKVVAFGFNAHGQLLPPSHPPPKDYGGIEDLITPRVIADAKKSARVLFAGWSDTLRQLSDQPVQNIYIVEIDDKLYLRGANSRRKKTVFGLPNDSKIILTAFGDHISLRGVLGHKNDLFTLTSHPEDPEAVCFTPSVVGPNEISKIAIAGNGNVCTVRSSKICIYRNLCKLINQQEPEEEWDFSDINGEIVDLKSNETAFTILTAIGTVYTFGDPRHGHLGRDLELTSSNKPGLVDALDGIRIAKISSGGWITAALSVERDLYIWGGRAGDKDQIQGLWGLKSDAVNLVVLGGGLDVSCASVGSGHLAALTADGRVWTVGRGDNGQLGVQNRSFQDDWKELEGVPQIGNAVEVVCGGWGTFIIFE